MDAYLRYGLLILAAFILGLIFLESWWRHKRFRDAAQNLLEDPVIFSEPTLSNSNLELINEPDIDSEIEPFSTLDSNLGKSVITPQAVSTPTQSSYSPVTKNADSFEAVDAEVSPYLAISVFANEQNHFESYDLLQAISATGMQFGELNIFHYKVHTEKGKKTLFSLASATKPGSFDLDKMGEFACPGLTLFLDLRNTLQPNVAFNKMFQTAQQLAEDLDGELRANPLTPWSEDKMFEYKRQIQYYEAKNKIVSNNDTNQLT